jgi:hypothetical protein
MAATMTDAYRTRINRRSRAEGSSRVVCEGGQTEKPEAMFVAGEGHSE